MPTDEGLGKLAPEKKPRAIRKAMARLRATIEERSEPTLRTGRAMRFAPAGQSTQMIVGADAATDADILTASARLYGSYRLKRVYYSAFSPIPDASRALPAMKPPLMREHRLYQADWLMRFYGFARDEIVAAAPGGMLDLAVDPKLAWALANRASFPVDVNRAPREMLLRVPGLGTRVVDLIVEARRIRRLRIDDLARLCASVAKVRPFVTADGWSPGALTDADDLHARLKPKAEQLSLF